MSFANLFKIRPVTGKHWYELLCHRVLRGMDVMPAHCSSTLPPVFGAVSLVVRRYTKRTPRPLNLEFTIQKLNTPLVEW